MQWYELAIFLGLSIVLGGFCFGGDACRPSDGARRLLATPARLSGLQGTFSRDRSVTAVIAIVAQEPPP